jgi:autotransporter strand-loop-strand O-heptosyltransferase
VIDNVYKPKYDYPESINPVLSEATSGEISSGDTMLYNVLELYNEVKINPNRIMTDNPRVEYNFIDGPFVELKGGIEGKNYKVSFYDGKKIIYDATFPTNHWARPSIKYFKNWVLNVKGTDNDFEWTHKFDPTGKKVFITFESNALGDTIAWMPYVEEFRLKYNGQICVSTHWNKLFDKAYPEIEFVPPGVTVHNLYALLRIGCYENWDENNKPKLNDNQSYGYSDTNRNPNGWRSIPLQKVATDILGLEYKEIRPRVNEFPAYETNEKYVTISEYSTMRAKQWNNLNGWYNVVKYLLEKGYKVLSLNNKESNTKGVISIHNKDITEIVSILKGSKLHIGMGSGLSWLSWALQTPTIIISGFSDEWSEPTVEGRIINENVCHGCYNDIYIPFDKSWLWCPRKKDYECTRAITSDMVIFEINKII